ncbi:MAG: ferrous iron transport protein B [Myxococcota bacterium]
MNARASQSNRVARIAVMGNPNAGKSTLFNALTDSQAQVGNFAGTTVTATSGRLRGEGSPIELIDVPGTYSLAASRPDERVAIDTVLGLEEAPPDGIVVVLDAPRLQRSSYLLLQLLELGRPTLVVVNLLDEAEALGHHLDLDTMASELGVPVVGTVARTGRGLDDVVNKLRALVADPTAHRGRTLHDWPAFVSQPVDAVAADLPEPFRSRTTDESEAKAVARWLLLSADDEGRLDVRAEPIPSVVAAREAADGEDLQAALIASRYAWIDARAPGWLNAKDGPRPSTVLDTERLDRVALHPIWGSLLFVGVMSLAFSALFSWADPLIGAVESIMGWVQQLVASGFDTAIAQLPGAATGLSILRDLVVDGIIGGVGAVVVFLPQVALLFLFLALLEDSGYLARAAHLADRVLRAAGLPGRAFVPLLSGYACAVPAILATRTLPRFRDRLLTMMVIPLTSCSARLPVYTLLVAALFPATLWGPIPLRPVALAGMYLFSTLVAVGAAVVLGRTVFASGAEPSLIELPPYRWPDPRVVLRQVVARSVDFLREAGGIILVATIALWALLSFPRYEPTDVLSPPEVAQAQAEGQNLEELAAPRILEQSYGGRLGRAIEPVIEPLGYDWKIGIGLIGAFAAREVFVATMGVVYGVGAEVDEESPALRSRLRDAVRPDGSRVYTPLTGLSIMVFFALSLQCLSTVAVLRKESGSWGWTAFTFVWMTALAYGAAFAVVQVGRGLGFT